MAKPPATSDLHFDIDASIVFPLGEELITDVVQALIELVKNCYDADATYAKVAIDTKANPGAPFKYPAAAGYIRVEDNGTGMDLATIRDGWLTISNSLKRKLKKEKKTTKRGRTPLGDKGLGRLGVQRLGDNVEIITCTKADQVAQHIAFTWTDFRTKTHLSDVPVYHDTVDKPRENGTSIVVSGLKDIAYWHQAGSIEQLQAELSRMISPYKEVRDFFVTVNVDGIELHLAEISDKVRNVAHLRYRIEFDGVTFQVRGRARHDFFRPAKDRDVFSQLVVEDDGEAFLAFMLQNPQAKAIGLKRCPTSGWFVEFGQKRKIEDFDKLALANEDIANPGPFYAEIDSFDLGRDAAEQQDVFGTLSEFRSYIKDLSGIRVYRDGFGIRVDRDWLGLGQQWTSAPSYYGLKPNNTLGFVAISAKDNAQLQETTDREGFTNTPYYVNFKEMLNHFVRFSETAQEFLRRSWTDFRKIHASPTTPTQAVVPTEELSAQLKEGLSHVAETVALANRIRGAVTISVENAQQKVASAAATLPKESPAYRDVQSAVRELQATMHEAKQITQTIADQTSLIGQLQSVGEQVNLRLESLREQLAEVYEVVSLGLTAEALSHEIHNISDGLAERTQKLQKHLGAKNITDAAIASFAEHVATSVAALRKQLAHLTPSLKYVRHKREPILMSDFLNETADYHRSRLGGANIDFDVAIGRSGDFTVFMNKGKLTQVFDNLCLNSEYWIREEMRLKRLERGVIAIKLAKPFMKLHDNGRGIDPSVEASLFQPFVTAKGRGKGRGLGLFIVRQLLDSDGCAISVLPTRNAHDRLYVFQVDFSGALHGDA